MLDGRTEAGADRDTSFEDGVIGEAVVCQYICEIEAHTVFCAMADRALSDGDMEGFEQLGVGACDDFKPEFVFGIIWICE